MLFYIVLQVLHAYKQVCTRLQSCTQNVGVGATFGPLMCVYLSVTYQVNKCICKCLITVVSSTAGEGFFHFA